MAYKNKSMNNATCESPAGQLATPVKPTEVTIERVSNGFLVNSRYGKRDTKIANTLAEALELARKAIE